MPFSLRSDEELVAEARRALEALGVEVVIDRASSSVHEFWEQHADSQADAGILTSRAAAAELDGHYPERCAAVLVAMLREEETNYGVCVLMRNRELVDVEARVSLWWRTLAVPRGRQKRACSRCAAVIPDTRPRRPCDHCHAERCDACAEEVTLEPGFCRCPGCSSWHLSHSFQWGVPWDMPRPAPTRRQATASEAAFTSALPQRMAAAVGPDGWLRLPPQHQRMHPVDVLVDGVLAALDGQVLVAPVLEHLGPQEAHQAAFTRHALRDAFDPGEGLRSVRRHVKRAVRELMHLAVGLPAPGQPYFTRPPQGITQEVVIQVTRVAARVHPTTDLAVTELSTFIIRRREEEEHGAAVLTGGAAAAAASSGSATTTVNELEWELVQVAPAPTDPHKLSLPGVHRVQVAYLCPQRAALPPAVQWLLQDAHQRVRGTGRGARLLTFWRDINGPPRSSEDVHLVVEMDAAGRLARHWPWALPRLADSLLRETRVAGRALHVSCQDKEATERLLGRPLPQTPAGATVGFVAGHAYRPHAPDVEAPEHCPTCSAVGMVVYRLRPRGEACEVLSHEEVHRLRWSR